MTRNQMIGVGCGGAGCLGLIVVVFAGFGVYWYNRPPAHQESNININVDRNANRNSNTSTSETNSNSNNSNSTSSETSATDGQHRLYQAANATYDKDLIKKVSQKFGLVDAAGTPTQKYGEFLKEHFKWIFHNTDWIQTINTEEKARAYVDAHIND